MRGRRGHGQPVAAIAVNQLRLSPSTSWRHHDQLWDEPALPRRRPAL